LRFLRPRGCRDRSHADRNKLIGLAVSVEPSVDHADTRR
jgi:hypothetical protein